jgi:hypothetical protein
MMNAIRVLAALSVFSVLTAAYFMVMMARYIRPDAPKGWGFYAFWLEEKDFIETKGVEFRNRYYLSLGVFLFLLLGLALTISALPEGS